MSRADDRRAARRRHAICRPPVEVVAVELCVSILPGCGECMTVLVDDPGIMGMIAELGRRSGELVSLSCGCVATVKPGGALATPHGAFNCPPEVNLLSKTPLVL